MGNRAPIDLWRHPSARLGWGWRGGHSYTIERVQPNRWSLLAQCVGRQCIVVMVDRSGLLGGAAANWWVILYEGATFDLLVQGRGFCTGCYIQLGIKGALAEGILSQRCVTLPAARQEAHGMLMGQFMPRF